jgi:hypothetical protein
MNTDQFKMIARKTAAKIYKTGYFRDLKIDVPNLAISFKDAHDNLYIWQTFADDIAGYFSIGKIEQWTEFAPTYESGYNTLGNVERARFNRRFIQHTDNPDYILRASKAYLLG